jgi:hypothetical protein
MAIYGDDDMIFPIDDKNQEVYNAISSLKNQNYAETTEEADEFLKKHTLHRNDRSKKDLNPYYCAICGINVLLMNSKLEKMPSRVTDGA